MVFRIAPYSANKTLYAIDWSSFESAYNADDRFPTSKARVNLIDTNAKGGVLRVTTGTLFYSTYDLERPMTPEELLTVAEGRHIATDSRWDGTHMWAPQKSLVEMNELAAKLDPMLKLAPDVPEGYDGWYVSSRR